MDGWTAMGLFFGYPWCCIQEFRTLAHLDDEDVNNRPLMGTGYVCCKKCASLPKELLLERIEKRRICSIPFPGEGKHGEMTKEYDEWIESIRPGGKKMQYDEIEIEQFETVLLVFGTDPCPETDLTSEKYEAWAFPIAKFLSERWGIEDASDSGAENPLYMWMRRYNTWCAEKLGIMTPDEVAVWRDSREKD